MIESTVLLITHVVQQEAIDIIEEAIHDAPSNKLGMLQAQVLKYLLRIVAQR